MRNIRLALVLLGILSALKPGNGQTANSAAVIGRVTDPSGAVVTEARVVLRNPDTNSVREQVTNDAGQYTFPDVAPGKYTITVTKTGFVSTTVQNQQFSVNNSYTVDIPLALGQTAETVEVSAQAGSLLQTTDAQVGNVVQEQELVRLPTLTRNAAELLNFQPGAAATQAVSQDAYGRTGGTVGGARMDQNAISLDGIDVTNQYTGGAANPPVLPLGVEAVSEFRVGVSNPNATFGRASGGQVTVTSRSGSNAFHGVGYYFIQNAAFNANTWDNNRVGLPRAPIHDSRGGFSFGGPIKKDKTFFFLNYEPRRFFQSIPLERTVPTASLRNGIISLGGVSYNLATSTACGPSGGLPCDPRGIGISPAIKAYYSLYPLPNDFTVGDGVNTAGYKFNAPAALTDDVVSLRIDHNFNANLTGFVRYEYSRDINPYAPLSFAQADLLDSGIASKLVSLGDGITSGTDWIIRPNFISSFRFGAVRERTNFDSVKPSALAASLKIPGTSSADGPIYPSAGYLSTIINQVVDIDPQRSRHGQFYTSNIEFKDDFSWLKGKHTISFGPEFRLLPLLYSADDKLVGFRNSPFATADADIRSLFIPPQNRPPGLSAANQAIWDKLYAATLGILDDSAVMVVRDKDLNPLPIGTPIQIHTWQRYYYFYLQDVWRILPSLTLSYGLGYGWQSAPSEDQGRLMVPTDLSNGKPIDPDKYLVNLRTTAQQGQFYNPVIAYQPYSNVGLPGLWHTDHGNIAPRIAVAWNPSASGGLLGKIAGSQKTVIRAGYGIVYDRTTTGGLNEFDTLADGYSQILTLATPGCNATGPGGANCGVNSTPGGSGFRIGVDGTVPVPPPDTKQTLPYVPQVGQGQWTYVISPYYKTGKSHVVDLSIQRELPGNLIVEGTYMGHFGRDLPLAVELTQVPYMFKDAASGQTFAQAFDATATAVRSGASVTSLPEQPFFANQFPKLAGGANCPTAVNNTQCIVSQTGSGFSTGNINSIFNVMDGIRRGLGLPQYANHESGADIEAHDSQGISNYNALAITVRNRSWHGLTFQSTYTYSKSLDEDGASQFFGNAYANSFFPQASYGPSSFDRRHIFNTLFSYNLPFGEGHKLGSGSKMANRIIGGWYLSGILQINSGLPLTVSQGPAFGSVTVNSSPAVMVPIVSPSQIGGGSYYSNVAGSGGVGTTGNPARGGSGLNLFANPQAAYNDFRPIQLSLDGSTGRGNPIRGLPFWNQDLRIGKETSFGERFKAEVSADMFNMFNHLVLADPSLSYTSPATFGVFTTQRIAGDRINGARWIQLGLRLAF